jgi:hypothetical protein
MPRASILRSASSVSLAASAFDRTTLFAISQAHRPHRPALVLLLRLSVARPMRKVVRHLSSRDLRLLELQEEHPQHSGQRLLRYELRRFAKCGAHAAEGLRAPRLLVAVHLTCSCTRAITPRASGLAFVADPGRRPGDSCVRRDASHSGNVSYQDAFRINVLNRTCRCCARCFPATGVGSMPCAAPVRPSSTRVALSADHRACCASGIDRRLGHLGQQQLGRLPLAVGALPRREMAHAVKPHFVAPFAPRIRAARTAPRSRRPSGQEDARSP